MLICRHGWEPRLILKMLIGLLVLLCLRPQFGHSLRIFIDDLLLDFVAVELRGPDGRMRIVVVLFVGLVDLERFFEIVFGLLGVFWGWRLVGAGLGGRARADVFFESHASYPYK
jgi:hypothetical protein